MERGAFSAVAPYLVADHGVLLLVGQDLGERGNGVGILHLTKHKGNLVLEESGVVREACDE